MTYEEYKKVTEFLGIELVAVIVNLNTEYDSFKNLDLVLGAENTFDELDEYVEASNFDVCKIQCIFWLSVNDYRLESYEVIEWAGEISNNALFHPKGVTPINQIVLRFPNFIKLISWDGQCKLSSVRGYTSRIKCNILIPVGE